MRSRDRFILENFWQIGNNCSSIALIKAAMIAYGSRVFKKRVERANKDLIITLRNKRTLRLSQKRIKKISNQIEIGFTKGKTISERVKIKKLKEQVITCFAVMVAYLVEYGDDKYEYTWKEAVKELTREGYYSDVVYKLLGLRNRIKGPNPRLKKIDLLIEKPFPIILYDRLHAVVVHELYYDYYGDLEPLEDIRDLYGEIRGCFWYRI